MQSMYTVFTLYVVAMYIQLVINNKVLKFLTEIRRYTCVHASKVINNHSREKI